MYRKNTAGQFITFQLISTTDGSAITGVSPAVRRCIDGTFAAGGGTVTEDTGGFYKYAMSQADTNGNNIGFRFSGTGAITVVLNIVTTACDPTTATNFGITALPAVASGSAGAVLVDGTGTAAISNSSGKVLLQATQTGVTIPTVTTVTNQLTAAAIATGVWQDTTAGDFTTALSVGKSVMNGVSLGTGLTIAAVSGAVGSVTGAVGSVTGAVGSVTGAVGSVTGAVGSVTGNVGGNVTGSVGSVVGAVGSVTGAVGSVTGNVGGNVVGSVASVTARVTANTDQLAGQTVTAAAGVTFPTSVASPTNITAGTITTATNLTNAPTAGDFTAAMKTSLNAATPAVTVSDKTGFSLTAAYDAAKTAAQAGDAMALTAAYNFAKGTTAMTESYAANGVAPTPVQAIMALHQMLMQFAISGTAITVKKLDNATTAFSVTLDDATNPTSAVRT